MQVTINNKRHLPLSRTKVEGANLTAIMPCRLIDM